jgi:hemerythrin-like metal-binding protein
VTAGKKILILVETSSLRECIVAGLKSLDVRVIEPSDVDRTIQMINNEDYDLILLDGEACGTNTIELLKIIREKNVKIPSVMFTELKNFKLKQEGLRLGVFDFVDKPICEEKMVKTVRLALERGKEFLAKSFPNSLEKKMYSKLEVKLDRKTLDQLEKICESSKISRDTYIQKAIQKAMTKQERTYSPSNFWSPQIITGVTWIDDQHYLLLLQIQEIYSLYFANKTKDKLADVFAFLYLYVENHFQQEEQMFYVLDDVEKAEHKSQHLHFKEKMAELNNEIQSVNNGDAVLELALYCQRWFISHIRVIDQNLVAKMKQAAICG